METINLFELKLSYSEYPELQLEPGIEIERWQAALQDDNLTLDIGLIIQDRYFLRLEGKFRIRKVSADSWGFESGSDGIFRFTDGLPNGGKNFEYLAGWINARKHSVSFTVIGNGYLGVKFPANRFVHNRQLPIGLRSSSDAVTSLILSQGPGPDGKNYTDKTIWFGPSSFEANSHVGSRQGNAVRLLYKQQWRNSSTVRVLIDEADNWRLLNLSRVVAADQSDGFLPLHAFKWADSLISPSIGISTNELELELGSWSDNFLIKRVFVPKGVLRAHSFHDANYNPLDWNFTSSTGKEFELAVQPWTAGSKLSSFVVRPGVQITCEQDSDKENVLGQRGGIRYPIVRKQASVFVAHSEKFLGRDIPGIDNSLLFKATGPVLKPEVFESIEVAKAGSAYRAGPEMDTWQMTGSGARLPLLPDEASGITSRFQSAYYEKINESLMPYKDRVKETNHESRHVMGAKTSGNEVSLDQFMAADQGPSLSKYETDYQYGYVSFRHTWSSTDVTDHFVVYEDGQTSLEIEKTFALDPSVPSEQIISAATDDPGGIATNSGRKILAVVKLSRGRKLDTLLKLADVTQDELDEMGSILPETLQSESWIGCVLFNQKVNLGDFPLLKSLVGDDLELRYLAVSPPHNADESFSTYGRILYRNERDIAEHPGSNQSEVLMQTRKVDITWSDRSLAAFYVESDILVRSCLGFSTDDGNGKPKPALIKIIGAKDKKTDSIRFLSRSDKPIPLLPKGGFGPLEQLFASRLEVVRIGKETKVDIDGDVKFKALEVDTDKWFDAEGEAIRFKGFGFRFNKLDGAGNWLKFDYPSFQFVVGNGGFDLLSFPFIKVRLKGLGIDFPDSGFDWNSLVSWRDGWKNDWGDVGHKFAGRFRLGFEMSRLPLLNAKPFEGINFDFEIGIPLKSPFDFDLDKMRVHFSAIGFNKLNLDLMRFLTIRAEKISFEAKEIAGTKVPWFNFVDVEVDVLEKNVIDNLTFHYFSVPAVEGRKGEKGFLGILDPKEDVDLFLIQIDWVLIGHNLSIPADVARAIVSIKSDWASNLADEINEAYKSNQLIPLSLQDKKGLGEWIFAAGIRVLYGVLSGKFLFQDNAYYGIALEGELFKEWFGWEFAIAVLYIQRERPEEDSFYIEMRMPLVSVGAIALKGGVIALEIQMNGGFLLDMGFPWLANNGVRDWGRAQGMYVSGLMGKGGTYIAKRHAVRVIKDNQDRALLMLAAGQAAMVGIGGAYSRGPFRVEAYAGVYIVCEGAMLLRKLDPVGLRLVGAVGIQVRGVGELRWWIISIRVEVVIGAEARLTLTWGIAFDPRTGQIGNPNEPTPSNPIEVQLDFILYARVSARACIGKSWFKICKGISTGVSLPYRQRLRLGA